MLNRVRSILSEAIRPPEEDSNTGANDAEAGKQTEQVSERQFDDGPRLVRSSSTDSPEPATDGGSLSQANPGSSDFVGDSPVAAFPKDFHDLFHLTKAPMFVTDAEGNAVVWNEGMAELTGSDEREARAADRLSDVWYHDGRRSMTLADKIIDTHQGARGDATPTHQAYDVEKVSWVDFELYQDESTFDDADGETRYIRFSAAPLYDGDEFAGVIEFVEDRTEDVRQRQDLEVLIEELTDTLEAVEDGNLAVRANTPELAHVDDTVVTVADSLNQTLDELEHTIERISEDSEQLRSSAQNIAERTDSITDAAAQQESSVQEVSDEVNTMSASVEEIASTAESVSDSASKVVSEADAGNEAAATAAETMSEVAEATDGVVDDVRELQDRVEQIDEVIDMIDDIAEQTNMLALNASIEAARAGEAGEGFAVVADEIKQLAGESQSHADEIERMVRSIQDDTETTAGNLEMVNTKMHTAQEAVDDVRGSIDTVADQIEETADGIEQVAAVTNDQADSAEEVASIVNDILDAAEEISADVEEIADRNAEHAQLADGIDESLERLAGR